MIRRQGRGGFTPPQDGVTPPRHRGTWHRFWSASIAAALSVGGASAWAQPAPVLPPSPVPGVSEPERPDAPAGAPSIPTAATAVPDAAAPPQAEAATDAPPPARQSGKPDRLPESVAPAPPQADAPTGAPTPPKTSEAIPLPIPGAAPATGDAADAAVPLPAWVPAACGDEPGYAEPSFATHPHHHHEEEDDASCRLSDVPIGIQPIPERPPLIVELNDHFLSPGFLSKGIELPTGEIVRPSFWVWGINQFGYNYFDNKTSPTKANELVDRLDLWAQLNLTATERFVLELRPLDKERNSKRIYTRVDFEEGKVVNGTNIDPETFFFEGDFGEIFPGLDPYDTKQIDYGFSIGRQPVLIQEGILINADQLDAFTVTRNTLNRDELLNLRSTFMVAWDRVHRNNDIYDGSAKLFGLYNELDFEKRTINVDLVYVNAGGNTGSAGLRGGQLHPPLRLAEQHLELDVSRADLGAARSGRRIHGERDAVVQRSVDDAARHAKQPVRQHLLGPRRLLLGGPQPRGGRPAGADERHSLLLPRLRRFRLPVEQFRG